MFEFLKYNIYLLFFLTLVYFIPAVSFIGAAYKQLGNPAPNEHPLSLFSIGAFIRDVGKLENDPTVIKITPAERREWVQAYMTLIGVSIIFMFLFLIWVRR